MPTNKNAQLRYQILDRCFSDFSRRYTFDDLMDEINETFYDLYGKKTSISVRTLRDDIRIMGDRMSYNAPIKAIPLEGRKCYYRYAERGYSIFKNELSIEEVDKLSSVIDILGRYRGNPNYAWIEETLNSLECRFGLKANTEHLVSFEQNERLKGLEFLSKIIDATINHETLQIKYHSFKGAEQNYVFFPYFVKQYNNRWFVFGKPEGKNNVINLAIDRILNVHLSDVLFVENNAIDFTTYFDDILGVTKMMEHEPEQIILKFTPARYPYIINKPIHKSQKVISEADHIVALTLRFNSELESRILYYGPDVEVLQPQWLKLQIIEKIKENLKKYSIMQKDCTYE